MAQPGQVCWVDLDATDAGAAKDFYGKLFGWTAHDEPANGGIFTRLRHAGHDLGSLFQLQPKHMEFGAYSHWTPYVQVDGLDETVRQAQALGGRVIVAPFRVDGVARIALILDAVGAQVGLWEPIPA